MSLDVIETDRLRVPVQYIYMSIRHSTVARTFARLIWGDIARIKASPELVNTTVEPKGFTDLEIEQHRKGRLTSDQHQNDTTELFNYSTASIFLKSVRSTWSRRRLPKSRRNNPQAYCRPCHWVLPPWTRSKRKALLALLALLFSASKHD